MVALICFVLAMLALSPQQSAAKSVLIVKPSFSSLIRKAKQSSCETFHGFEKFMGLRFDIIVYQVPRRQWNAHLKRAVIDHRFPMRLHIAYGHICADFFHFDLRHRRRSSA